MHAQQHAGNQGVAFSSKAARLAGQTSLAGQTCQEAKPTAVRGAMARSSSLVSRPCSRHAAAWPTIAAATSPVIPTAKPASTPRQNALSTSMAPRLVRAGRACENRCVVVELPG